MRFVLLLLRDSTAVRKALAGANAVAETDTCS